MEEAAAPAVGPGGGGTAEAAPTIAAGRPWPLGTHCRDGGVNVAVFSSHAVSIDLCLFDLDPGDPADRAAPVPRETARLRLPARTGDVFHGFVPGLRRGQVYGLRADGPWAPREGHCFNAHKLLLDPYAREIVGRFAWRPEHRRAAPDDADRIDSSDNAAFALKARVVDDASDAFDWGDDGPPPVAPADTVIYELHVKAFSRANPDVPAAVRGTYAGLAAPASIAHLRRLGVTAVELLPVHQWIDEERLVTLGLVNHWGYNSIGFFAPEPRLAAARTGRGVRDEFRAMVKALHAAGIEVLLDVVYNHTAESDAAGPTIAFRGLDNAGCYRLDAADPRHCENHTGCGNTVDLRRPQMLRLVLDSLRYWVTEMHVDGFRFDLATVLGRGDAGFDPRGAFFAAVAQDPVLSRVKLIAEPWDLGPGGYQAGAFPRGWLEWNDRFRDDMRGYWLQGTHARSVLARRLCASADLFHRGGRLPSASVNYVVSHDGFTLRDLLTYEQKRNAANGEDNRDGTAANLGWNCGVEGPTADPQVGALRGRLQRALLATTLLAQGTPMLSQGDELGHTQHGNNNPYCQDNPTTWIDWTGADEALIDFTAHVVALRRAWLPFADRWYADTGPDAIEWTGGDGEVLHAGAWSDWGHRALGCLIRRPGRGDRPLLLLANAGITDVDFVLPAGAWTVVLDSTDPRGRSDWTGAGPAPCPLPQRGVLLLVGATAVAARHLRSADATSRASGILLHPTSLPGPHGSGDFGPAAYHFVDWLVSAGQTLWQLLPLGGVGPGDSPYMSSSAFAGNPLLIDLGELAERGWLTDDELRPAGDLADGRVHFGAVVPFRIRRLERAADRFAAAPSPDDARQFADFCAAQANWLDDYALFMALVQAHDGALWSDWPAPLAQRRPQELAEATARLADAVRFWKFCQWCFFRQWRALKRHANDRGVRIVGDAPIFIALQSAEVWVRQELFELDPAGRPTVVAGVPPDAFSATGQHWGNPLYRWPAHADEGYAWWVERIRRTFELVDIVRIDHFRGFCAHWEIPAHEATAVNGRWVTGPGAALFDAIGDALGPLPIVAEDLGVITPDVVALRRQFDFPGMCILQFAFGGDATNPYLPHNHGHDAVVYPGTHDNDTTLGWWADATPAERHHVRDYLGVDGSDIHWALIRAAQASAADTAIVAMQDVLGARADARMNFPGRADGNWAWRFEWRQVEPRQAERLAHWARLYGRAGTAPG